MAAGDDLRTEHLVAERRRVVPRGAGGLQVGRGLVRLGLCGEVGGVRLDAKENPLQLQLGLGHHTEVLHLQLRGGGVVVDVPQREHTAAAQQHQAHGGKLDGGGHGRPAQASAPAGAVWDQSGPEAPGQHRGGRHHGDGKPVGQHIAHRHLPEGLGHHGHFGQREKGEKRLEHVVIHQLGADPKGDQGGADGQQDAPPAGRDSAAQQAQQHRHGQRKQKGKDRALHREGPEAVELEKEFLIIDDR